MRNGLRIPALGQHTNRNHIANLLTGFSFLTYSIYHFTQSSSGLSFATGCRFCLVQCFGINAQGQIRVAKFRYRNPLVVKGILDTCCGFSSVGNRNHYWRNRAACVVPCFIQCLPILAKQIIGLRYQVRQRFFFFCCPVNIVFHSFIRIDMIQLRLKITRIGHAVIADYHTRCLYQTSFNPIVQTKIADDPAKQGFFIVLFARWRKWSS